MYCYMFAVLFLLFSPTLFGSQPPYILGPTPEARVFSFVEHKDTKGLAAFLRSEQGALTNFATQSLNFQRSFDGNRPLFRAAATNNPDMVLLLRKYGADPNIVGTIFLWEEGSAATAYKPATPDKQINFQISPLLWAVKKCNPELVRALTVDDCGIRANPAYASRNGYTPLAELACLTRKYITSELYARSYDPEHKANAERIRCQIANYLIQAGDDVNATSPDGNSVIAHALRLGLGNQANLPIDFIILLIRNGLNLNALYYTGQTIREVLEALHCHAIDEAIVDITRPQAVGVPAVALASAPVSKPAPALSAKPASNPVPPKTFASAAAAAPVTVAKPQAIKQQAAAADAPVKAAVKPTKHKPSKAEQEAARNAAKLEEARQFDELLAQFAQMPAPEGAAVSAPVIQTATFTAIVPPYNYERALAVLRGVVELSDLSESEQTADQAKVLLVSQCIAPESVFLKAVATREYDTVARMLADDPDVINAITVQGYTALHIAASLTDTKMCRLLCDHGADVNKQSFLGETPLAKVFDFSPSASEVREAATFKFLESRGARLDILDYANMHVLHNAVSNVFCALTDYLCSRPDAADYLRLKTLTQTNHPLAGGRFCRVIIHDRQLLPLDFSIHLPKPTNRHKYIFKLLIDKLNLGDLLQLVPAEATAARKLLRAKFTAYSKQCSKENLNALYEVVDKHVPLRSHPTDGVEIYSPLYKAVYDGDSAAARVLCTTDQYVRHVVNMTYTKDRASALQLAVAQFNVDLVADLLRAGADVHYALPANASLMAGMTALHIVAHGGIENVPPKKMAESDRVAALVQIINLLVDAGADVNAMTTNMFDPLSCVIQTPSLSLDEKMAVITTLAAHGAKFDTIYPGNYTVLHYATLLPREHMPVVHLICDIVGKNNDMYAHVYDGAQGLAGTALGVAASLGRLTAALCLFDYAGVNKYVTDESRLAEISALRQLLDEIDIPHPVMYERMRNFLAALGLQLAPRPEESALDPANAAALISEADGAGKNIVIAAAEPAYLALDISALEAYVREARCKTVYDFFKLINITAAIDYLRSNVLKNMWQNFISAPSHDERIVALDRFCHTLHSFTKKA